MKKTLILISILMLYLITFSSPKTHRSEEEDDSRDDKPVSRSHSYSKSVFYSSSNINGKKRSRYSKSENEEHRTKKGNNPALVRKFNQKWDKRNDGPLVHKRKAYSNHPDERKYLRNRWRKRYYSRREEKKFMRNFRKNFSGKFWNKKWNNWWKKGFSKDDDDEFEREFRKSKFWKHLSKRKRELKRKFESKDPRESREPSRDEREFQENY